MNNFEIQMQIANNIKKYSHIMVAFSGGLDSTVLLHALVQLRINILPNLKIHAIHIHHGLSMNADLWVNHCISVCDQWMVKIKVLYITIDTTKYGVEAAARKARYYAIANTIHHYETLVTAHHLDDQCETFLLALKRGSGPTGLSSMAHHMPFCNNEHIRPLLNISRIHLEKYAYYYKLKWVEDYSNKNNRFDRNFIRLHIIPALHNRWPYFSKSVARSAQLCAEQEKLLDELLKESLKRFIHSNKSLSIEGLLSMSEIKRYALLRRWISYFDVMMPTRTQIKKIWLEVAMARKDAHPKLQLGTKQIRRYRKYLFLLPLLPSLKERIITWDPTKILSLPDGLGTLQLNDTTGICVRVPKINEIISLRFVVYGKLRIKYQVHAQPIKKIWREYNIPPWERERIPMLYYNEELIAIIGVCITQSGQAIPNKPFWYIKWVKNFI
ncbi:tRNA(Ile)-lysidine synthase [Candidatus Profftia lariciata]|uniref:tRNA lysidine(34) synthetase TilS n=1 Tax=Candidatus Profftia lariciata TaxID=1987921 RepID=UPI001D010E31|nr:tRNA lysidine(34) synthetase TilS [Candidatus Profftia lariciata]UDG81677.1 tRNA(Ile)-lysidine synthase [Candidatus Profftia lariciata]